ncbi:molybdopterin-dependent oxidoreductase [Tsuneonella sp. CC-YZS046]|uniref:molybdopterin-dependent oxidoreductase n=1 Tax=Tsuneonella sp. CC-YZS046 TaxID=3042152 RepID=UPI002D78D76B|nr:molybdopterin-dependent oxidoreductase [Tsuneonella sp. CC-YZS046]WRO65736.1 molybdopterin-dependent oxidoreductase [Tsuneonella sp. CC-YZS046]
MGSAPLSADTEVHYRICPFCEQNCATEVTIDRASESVVTIRGDKADPLSKGYICPKAYALKDLHHDPEMLTGPLMKRNGRFEEVSWAEALDFTAARLAELQRKYGPNSIASYFGTGLTHVPGLALYAPLLLTTLGSNQVYSASSVDSHAHFMTTATMFGGLASMPIPDIDNSDYFVLIGANPLQSNGSFLTAPGVPRRLRDIQARQGKVVAIDPRRSETAQMADWHLSIRPGSDAVLLLAVAHVLFGEGLVDLRHIADHAKNLDELRAIAMRFTPETASAACDIPAEDIRRLARELAAAPRACIYGRIGSSMQQFGSITNWLIVAVNALTGNLDRPGGSMFPRGVFEAILFSERYRDGSIPYGRWHTRVSGLPELGTQLPCAAMMEEMDTPGEGQVQGLITLCGNPALSTPNGGGRLTRALEQLDFILSFDIFINETTRHADVILPSPKCLAHSDFMVVYPFFTVRDYIRWSAPVFEAPPGALHDCDIMCELVARLKGITAKEADELALRMLHGQLREQGNPVAGHISFEDALEALTEQGGQDRMFELLVRSGTYGDHFGERPDGLTLEKLKAMPHGVDFGPMQPRIAEVIHFPDGKIDFAPEAITRDLPRLEQWLAEGRPRGLHLLGRRHMRSFNTWMHNFPSLSKGPNPCTLLMNPRDAELRQIVDGQYVRIRSRTGAIDAPVELSDEIREGVVSLPHGWGHDDHEVPGQERAKARAGVNYNLLADESLLDVPSCNTNLNHIPVEVTPLQRETAQP